MSASYYLNQRRSILHSLATTHQLLINSIMKSDADEDQKVKIKLEKPKPDFITSTLWGRAWASSKRVWHTICHEQEDIFTRDSLVSHMTTARTGTVSVATYAWTKLYTKVMSWITRKCRTLWGRAWASSFNGYMHMNRLSFMLKWWAESLAFMSVVYAQPLPEAISNPSLA